MNAVIALIVSCSVHMIIILYVRIVSPLVPIIAVQYFAGKLTIFTQYIVFYRVFKSQFIRFHRVIFYPLSLAALTVLLGF